MLRQEMEVRRIALEQFGPDSVPTGQPLSLLEARLLPLYLHHRYQLQAAVKMIGGGVLHLRGEDGRRRQPAEAFAIAPPAEQRAALAAVLETHRAVVPAVPAAAAGAAAAAGVSAIDGGTAEMFDRRTAPAFDQMGAATVAADLAVSALLNPQRAARLVDFHAQQPAEPGLDEVLRRAGAPGLPGGHRRLATHRIGHRPRGAVAGRLAPDGIERQHQCGLRGACRRARRPSPRGRALAGATDSTAVALREDIARHLAAPDEPTRRTPPLARPQGEPIGK